MSGRLPIYLLIDCSGAMRGDPIQAVRAGADSLVNALLSNPATCACAYLSVITFENKATVLTPLTPLTDFIIPDFDIHNGGSFLGAALELLEQQVRREIRDRAAPDSRDYFPRIFIFTDRKPSDAAAYHRMAQRIRNGGVRIIRPQKIYVYPVSFRALPLPELTDNALIPNGAQAFFDMMSDIEREMEDRAERELFQRHFTANRADIAFPGEN